MTEIFWVNSIQVYILCFGVYIALSLILFYIPNFIHKRKTYNSTLIQQVLESPTHKVLLVAHAGGAQERLENTIEAFQSAVLNGCHMLELDVHMTKDKVLVASHDDNLSRLCNKATKISQLNYDELPRFAGEIEQYFGQDFQNKNRSLKFAKLEDIFRQFPNILMHIDLKSPAKEAVHEINNLVKIFHREDLTVWGSLSARTTKRLNNVNPKVLTFCPTTTYIWIIFSYLIGLLPFIPLSFNFFSVPKFSVYPGNSEKHKNEKQSIFFKLYIFMLNLLNLQSPLLFKHLQKRGILVIWWVLNDSKDFSKALKAQVNGIMTDYPCKLKEFLIKHNKYADF